MGGSVLLWFYQIKTNGIFDNRLKYKKQLIASNKEYRIIKNIEK